MDDNDKLKGGGVERLKRFKVRGTRFKLRDTRFKIRGTRFKLRDARFKIRGTRYEVQGAAWAKDSWNHFKALGFV